ncbi:hypothetical protein [Sphaerisporangium corydalis]|uniref:Uncharacterized protein n=1 Tax=Sphaerisporangium corydalis TaxID=1441875 RepID=A0ABV9EA12_9ACTN|nr:hypothetical protein [Sphaerisporangium corydalis]
MVADERVYRHPAARAAHRLSRTLEHHGIPTQVHEGRGLALVSVWLDLVAWTDGACFWWSGGVSETTRRRTYSFSPVDDPVTAARRIADRYAELRQVPPAKPVPAPRGTSSKKPKTSRTPREMAVDEPPSPEVAVDEPPGPDVAVSGAAATDPAWSITKENR